jgi:hypothetical protein
MALTSHIKGSMITTICTHLRMFQNSKFYKLMIQLKPVLGGVDGNLHQYGPWTGSIKPSLQDFQFCCAGLSVGILISLYSIATLALFVPCGGCNKSPRAFNEGCYISDPKRLFSTKILLCLLYVTSFYLAIFVRWFQIQIYLVPPIVF